MYLLNIYVARLEKRTTFFPSRLFIELDKREDANFNPLFICDVRVTFLGLYKDFHKYECHVAVLINTIVPRHKGHNSDDHDHYSLILTLNSM